MIQCKRTREDSAGGVSHALAISSGAQYRQFLGMNFKHELII